MRFAFVVSFWYPFGGMQRTLLRIARACVAAGHEVDVFTGEWRGERPYGIGVFELDTRARSNHASNDRLASAFAAAAQARNYDCRVGFTKIPGLDVYYAADPCYAARAAESKPFFYTWWTRYRAFFRQEQAVFARGAGAEILLIAHQEKVKFIRYYATEDERFHLLPPGINRDRLVLDDPAGLRRRLRTEFGLAESTRALLCVGSGFQTKGVDRVIEALAALPKALRDSSHLLVVGRGKEGAMRRLAARRGVGQRVTFCGTRDDVAGIYRAADFLVHAARSENTGTVLIEAMLCGLPVLVTGNCGFAHHVQSADAGLVIDEPIAQARLDEGLAALLQSDRVDEWRHNGPEYCSRTDLYSLIDLAVQIIVERAERDREAHAARP